MTTPLSPDIAAVILAAATMTGSVWTRTNLGPSTTVTYRGTTHTVQLPAGGEGKATITWSEAHGDVKYIGFAATWAQTAALVDAALDALSPR
jgi:hypothetical protein